MVLAVHLRLSAVAAIVDCPDQGQLIEPLSLKQAAPKWIWLFRWPYLQEKSGPKNPQTRKDHPKARLDCACHIVDAYVFKVLSCEFTYTLSERIMKAFRSIRSPPSLPVKVRCEYQETLVRLNVTKSITSRRKHIGFRSVMCIRIYMLNQGRGTRLPISNKKF
jgi:hypothetical protein